MSLCLAMSVGKGHCALYLILSVRNRRNAIAGTQGREKKTLPGTKMLNFSKDLTFWFLLPTFGLLITLWRFPLF